MAEDAKKKAADDKAALEKLQTTQRERATGKPTPTQEELNAHSQGGTVTGAEHEADGSAVEAQLTTEELPKVQAQQREKATGKPTPTQKELDAHNTGEAAAKLEADGSTAEGDVTKELEAHKPAGGGYSTRTMHPAASGPPPAPASGRRGTASHASE
jgi:hypothetical protein